jgi:tetratricopeptide (TPR) repeat protein
MNQKPPSALDLAREQLHEADEDRRNPRRRGLFWDAETWDKIFERITELEDNRDQDLQQQIDQMRKAGQIGHIQALLRKYDTWIAADVAWYKAREAALRVLRERWETDHSVEPLEIDQLARHYAQIAYRLCERRVVHGKSAIEILEDRRQQSGAPIAKWPAYWNRLTMAFRAQDAAYWQVHGKPIPPSFNKERLRWCVAIRNRQRTTKASKLGRARNFDRAGLDTAMALVDQQIAQLHPPPAHKLDIRSMAIIAGIIVFVVIAFSALGRFGSKSTDALRPTTSAAEATALPRRDPAVAMAQPPTDARSLDSQGIELMRQARYDQALKLFQQEAAANPNSYVPQNNIAFCLYELGLADQAIAQWRAALELSNQNSPDANAGLGMALYYVDGRSEEGLRYYQRAIALNEDYRNEDRMRREHMWGDKAIAASRPLRDQLAP